jgi:hypothetical protein
MIVPTPSVARYLLAKQKEGFLNFELIVFEGTHGEVTVLPKWVRFVAKKIFDHSHQIYSTSPSTIPSPAVDTSGMKEE